MKNKTFVDKVYKLTRNAAPLSFMLPTRHSRRFPLLYFDEVQGTNRTLRYARNQKSPFEDEQDGNIVMEPVIFEDGFLRVPKDNPVLQEFLHYHPLNGKKFVEVNEEKDATDEVNQFNLEVDALIEARKLTVSQVENIGRVLLGIDTTRVTTAELRRDILVYVKRDPAGFMKIVNDPMLKLQSKVKLFFDNSLLSFRNKRKEVWFNTANNKKKMLTVPYGEDPLYIVSSYLQSDDGLEHLKMLEGLLENDY
tara:strand:- start:512 stop:1264 length:753 start_codon:yes stop_codon:yes gene_type:complete